MSRDIRSATRAHYDRWSYDFDTAEHDAMQAEGMLGRALAAVGPDATVLDAGCGTGLVSRLARAASKARTVVGLDMSSGSLRRAASRSRGVSFVRGDILALPLRDQAAELVISRGVIMTTGDPEGALRQLARATKAGGHLYIRVYNRRNVYRWVYQLGSPVCRAIARLPGGVPLLAALVVPPFWLVLQVCILALRGRFASMSFSVLWNVFADQLLVPWNSFHTIEEVQGWGEQAGVRCLETGSITLGQQIELLFRKER